MSYAAKISKSQKVSMRLISGGRVTNGLMLHGTNASKENKSALVINFWQFSALPCHCVLESFFISFWSLGKPRAAECFVNVHNGGGEQIEHVMHIERGFLSFSVYFFWHYGLCFLFLILKYIYIYKKRFPGCLQGWFLWLPPATFSLYCTSSWVSETTILGFLINHISHQWYMSCQSGLWGGVFQILWLLWIYTCSGHCKVWLLWFLNRGSRPALVTRCVAPPGHGD